MRKKMRKCTNKHKIIQVLKWLPNYVTGTCVVCNACFNDNKWGLKSNLDITNFYLSTWKNCENSGFVVSGRMKKLFC